MTDEEFLKCKERGIQLWEIWFDRKGFHKKKLSYERFDESWIARDWLNKSFIFGDHEFEFMYATEDQLENCKRLLLQRLKKNAIREFKQAKTWLNKLEQFATK